MDLGQVFTNSVVADFMVSLFSLPSKAKILEPCFGDGAFIGALSDSGVKYVYGCEIDKGYYDDVNRKYPNYKLFHKNFFSLEYKNFFDGVILNPPYVRHEKIDDMASLGVSKAILRRNPLFKQLPESANLYMYFVLGAVSMLKKNGELVVIFPASWMQAKNGKIFSDKIEEECSIVREIHISGPIFAKKALVDVVILKVCRDGLSRRNSPEYMRLHEGSIDVVSCENVKKLELFNKSDSFFSLASAKRGLTTGYNDFFVNPHVGKVKKILSSPKKVPDYTTKTATGDSVLAVTKRDVETDQMLQVYVSAAEKKIVLEKKPKVIYEKIQAGEAWYELNFFNCTGIVFSYFIRDDIKFVLNKSFPLVRDNFYIIRPKIDEWLVLGLLNNIYCYYQLELLGKRYGAGLLKIQRYDLDALKFPALESISSKDKNRIIALAKKIVESTDSSVVQKISEIVAKYSVVSLEKIQRKYDAVKKNRLELV